VDFRVAELLDFEHVWTAGVLAPPRRGGDESCPGAVVPLVPFRSPWQNGYVERLIGSIRRECTDHLLVFNAEHLRRILAKYASYYNEVRTHVALGKDTPCRRPIELFGDIVAYPILGGLHHRYTRI
jgi:hypothetical protein